MRAARLIGGLAVCMAWLAVAGCEEKSSEVVVYTSVDQVFYEPVLRAFEQESGIRVRMVFDTEETKSTGLLNRLIAEAGRPQADVFWSNDPVRSQVLVRRGLVAPYRSPAAADIPDGFKAQDGSWVGFSARARVILVNRELVPLDQTPKSIQALVDPRWKGRAAVANPAYGTTTMHLAALFDVWGDERVIVFLNKIKKNGIRIASSNGEVKRLVASGEVAWGLTDTDDAAVAVRSGAPVEVVYPDTDGMGTLLMPTTAVLIKGAPHPAEGRRMLDFLVSAETERRLAFAPCAQLPLRKDVEVPSHVRTADTFKVMKVDYARVARVMERVHPLLRDWAE